MTEEELQNLSPEEFANTDVNDILSTLGITDEYAGYFQKFDDTKLNLYKEGYQTTIEGLDAKMKNLIGTKETDAATTQKQTLLKQTGFSSTGDTQEIMDEALKTTENIIAKTESDIDLGKKSAKNEMEIKKHDLYKDHQDRFFDQASNVYSNMQEEYPMIEGTNQYDPEYLDRGRKPSWSNWFGGKDHKGNPCVVSTALNDTGAWSDEEQYAAVKWCRKTHHDGSERGRTWVKGYHTWGKFLSKWVKKSNIIKWVVNTTTTAFMDHTERNKPNYLGWMIHHLWINPLSYTIGYSKKNRYLGKIATSMMIGIYIILFPLFALASIPHILRRNK